MPTRPLSPHSSEESVRDDARRLLRDRDAGDPGALQRLREFLPRLRGADDKKIAATPLKWNDALLAIAREYGFESWSRIKAHLELVQSNADCPLHEQIKDGPFRRAVELMDQGDQAALAAQLVAHPDLAHKRVHFEGGNYFRRPNLLAFIAENPVRHGRLPANAASIAETILHAGGGEDKAGLDETLALVASGQVPRESGVQVELIRLLCSRGADPAKALQPALAQGELRAAHALLQCGAALTLSASAAFGLLDEARQRLPKAGAVERHRALANAAQLGHAEIILLLLDAGGLARTR